uniref:Centromere protein K n=1 Tax=Sphenodon punctatus TaxID=8508 RepID=A0A8D0HMD2_SPHPU
MLKLMVINFLCLGKPLNRGAKFVGAQKTESGTVFFKHICFTFSFFQLQKLDHDLEMVLSAVQAKNKKLKEDFKREQEWLEEQQQLIEALNVTEKEMKTQVIQFSEERAFQGLKSKMLKIKAYKEEILSALGEFLEEHFPLPDKDEFVKKKTKINFMLLLIFQNLINKLMDTPHDPYLIINSSFWPPYIELLLRYGIALRHPEDPNRIRLEAFHQ